MKRIGVLALQGGVQEHLNKLSMLEGVSPVTVKYEKDFSDLQGLIIPGGESTTIGRLLRDFKLLEPLKRAIEEGLPVWGTCAGMILLAKHLLDDNSKHLEVMNIHVQRNAFGAQLDSFLTKVRCDKISNAPIPLVFIRAPYVDSVGEDVEVLLDIEGKIVACKEKNMLATSFHPELTEDLCFHKFFANMCN